MRVSNVYSETTTRCFKAMIVCGLASISGAGADMIMKSDSIFFIEAPASAPEEIEWGEWSTITLRDSVAPTSPPPQREYISPDERLQAHLKRGAEYFLESKWGPAMNAFMMADRMATNQPVILERVAISAALAGHYAVAEDYFLRYLIFFPSKPVHLVGMAGVLVRQGRYQEANPFLDRALAIQPEDIGAHLNKVIIEFATQSEMSWPFPWKGLGLEDTLSASTWLRQDRAELEGLTSPEIVEKIVSRVLGSGSYEHLDKIPDLVRAVISGAAGTGGGHREDVLRLLDYGVRNEGTLSEMARLFFIGGEKDKALDIMAQLAESLPEKPMVSYNHGLVLLSLERYDEAALAFQREVQVSPDYADARFGLACAYAGLGQINEAWPILRELTNQYPSRMAQWMEGDEPYLAAIRADPRFPGLKRRF